MHNRGDFHMHTSASDGGLSPANLVKKALKSNVDIISLTDHDTTEGVDEAVKSSLEYNLKVVPGIELSTIHNGESIHILGYFRDESYKDSSFQNFLTEMKNYRTYRAKKIIENLSYYFNIELDYKKIYENAKGVIARPHIARAILESGYNYSWEYIFNNLIGKDSPAYVHNKQISIPEGISILKERNALVVLAHPVLIKKTSIEELLLFDFDGVEALYFLNTAEDNEKFISLAKVNNKLITAGSDFHGIDSNDTKHGSIGSVALTGRYLDAFISNLNL